MSHLQNSQMIAVALGATIGIVGAASLYFYQKIMEHREREQMMNNLENVNKKVSELQIALDNMRSQQEQQKARRSKNLRKRVTSANSFYSATETDNDAVSIADTDIDDEFYDCSDDEVLAEEIENGTTGIMLEVSQKLNALEEKIEREVVHDEVLDDLRSLAPWHDSDIEVAWRLARVCFKYSEVTNPDYKIIILREGINVCKKQLDEEHGELHKWHAALFGSHLELQPIREKIRDSKRFVKYLRQALELMPDDALLNHIQGRYHYIVSDLSWVEKKISEAIFGEALSSTYEKAIEHMEKVEKIAPEPYFENKYYLGMAYLKIKTYQKGVEMLKELCNLPTPNTNNKKSLEAMRTKASQSISTYSNYC